MRKRSVAIGLAAVGVVSVFSMAGCSVEDEGASSLSLALEGNGKELKLVNGAPLARDYQAVYPVENVERMVVSVKADGHLSAKCVRNGVTSICDDTPFFAKVTRIGKQCQLRTRVYDVNGKVLIDTKSVRDWQAKAIATGSFLGTGTGTSDGVPEEDFPRGRTVDGVGSSGVATGGGIGSTIGASGSTNDGTTGTGGAGGVGSIGGSGTGSAGGTTGGTTGDGSSGSGASAGTNPGGSTIAGGCPGLRQCCDGLSGAMRDGCLKVVAGGNGSYCDSMNGAYTSMGYCGERGGTMDGSSGSGGAGGTAGGRTGDGTSGAGGAGGTAGGNFGGGAAGGANVGGNTGDADDDNPDCPGGLGGGAAYPGVPGGGAAGGSVGGKTGDGTTAGGGGTGGGTTNGGTTNGGTNGGGTTGGGTTGSGPNGGGSGMCPPDKVDQTRAKFCADVNDWLKQHNVAVTLDCKMLDGNFNLSAVVPPKNAKKYRCLDIIHDAWYSAYGSIGNCGTNGKDIVYNWKETSRYDIKTKGACNRSPIVLDLDGNGLDLSSIEGGVTFDLFATGDKVKTAWPSGADGLLAIDLNHDGKIDTGAELFGEDSFGRGDSFDDGFQALAELDFNRDGVVDAKDPAFNELVVWRDANRDGVSQPSELVGLRDLGIKALVLNPTRVEGPSSSDRYGNQIPLWSHFVRNDGSKSLMADAYFRYRD